MFLRKVCFSWYDDKICPFAKLLSNFYICSLLHLADVCIYWWSIITSELYISVVFYSNIFLQTDCNKSIHVCIIFFFTKNHILPTIFTSRSVHCWSCFWYNGLCLWRKRCCGILCLHSYLELCSNGNFHKFLILQLFTKPLYQRHYKMKTFVSFLLEFHVLKTGTYKSIFPLLSLALIWSWTHSLQSSNFFNIASWKYSCSVMKLSLPPATVQFSC